MTELYDLTPEAHELAAVHSLDLGGILLRAYRHITDVLDYGSYRDAHSIDDVANHGYCRQMTAQVTRSCNRELTGGGLVAYTSVHEISELEMEHHFTAFPHPSDNPMHDTVIDGTYKQFLYNTPHVGSLPYAFVGSRAAIIAVMEALSPDYAALYAPERSLLHPRSLPFVRRTGNPCYVPHRSASTLK